MVHRASRSAAIVTGGHASIRLERTTALASGPSAMLALIKEYTRSHGRLVAYVDGILEDERRQFLGGRTPTLALDSASIFKGMMNGRHLPAPFYTSSNQLEKVRETLCTLKGCDAEILQSLQGCDDEESLQGFDDEMV